MRKNIGIFRGMRKDNGKWVEGYYLCLHQDTDTDLHIIVDEHGEYNPVAPKTVGEFTGLTDKNGKRIFEGDILKYYDTVHKVVFCTVNGSAFYGIEWRDRGEIWAFDYMTTACDGEVIGNIHDNPEMLERE